MKLNYRMVDHKIDGNNSYLKFEFGYEDFGNFTVKVTDIQFQVANEDALDQGVRCLYNYDIEEFDTKPPADEQKMFEHVLGTVVVDYLKKTVDEK